jgi:hypothetical protein
MIFSQKGNATFVALGITSVLLVSAAGAGAIISSTLQESPKVVNSNKAFFAAEGAVESALYDASETGIGYTIEHETAPEEGDPGYFELTTVNNTKAQWETAKMAEVERDRTLTNLIDEAKKTIYLPSRKADTGENNMDAEVKNEFLKANWQQVRFGDKYTLPLYNNTTQKYKRALRKTELNSDECPAGTTCEETKSIFSSTEDLSNMFIDVFIPGVQGVVGEIGGGASENDRYDDYLGKINNVRTGKTSDGTESSSYNNIFGTTGYIEKFFADYPENETIKDGIVNSIKSEFTDTVYNSVLGLTSSSSVSDIEAKEDNIINVYNSMDTSTLDFRTELEEIIADSTDVEISVIEGEPFYDIEKTNITFYGDGCNTPDGAINPIVKNDDGTKGYTHKKDGIKIITINFQSHEDTGYSDNGSSCQIQSIYMISAEIHKNIKQTGEEFSEDGIIHSHPTLPEAAGVSDLEITTFNNELKTKISALINEVKNEYLESTAFLKNGNYSRGVATISSTANIPLFTWAIQAEANNFQLDSKTVENIYIDSVNRCNVEASRRGVVCYGDLTNFSDPEDISMVSGQEGDILIKKKIVADKGLWVRIYNPVGLVGTKTEKGKEISFPATILKYINRSADDLRYVYNDELVDVTGAILQKPVLNFRMGRPQEWTGISGENVKKRDAYIRFGFEYPDGTLTDNTALIENFPVPDDAVRIKATGESGGYTQDIEVSVKPQEVAPMFDYAVFQQ